jgi:putative hemolysin
MRLWFLSGAILGILACSQQTHLAQPSAAPLPAQHTSQLDSSNLEQCSQRGGTIEPAGMRQLPHCVIKLPDGGKPCKNSHECLNGCVLWDAQPPTDAPITGTCRADNLPFGCYAPVENGKAGPFLCAD